MKLLISILLLTALKSFAAPNWKPIVELKDSSVVFSIDEDSFSRRGDRNAEATVKVSPKDEYHLQKWSANCETKEASILSIQQFKSDGTLVKVIQGPMKVYPIPVGSAAEHIVKELCSRTNI